MCSPALWVLTITTWRWWMYGNVLTTAHTRVADIIPVEHTMMLRSCLPELSARGRLLISRCFSSSSPFSFLLLPSLLEESGWCGSVSLSCSVSSWAFGREPSCLSLRQSSKGCCFLLLSFRLCPGSSKCSFGSPSDSHPAFFPALLSSRGHSRDDAEGQRWDLATCLSQWQWREEQNTCVRSNLYAEPDMGVWQVQAGAIPPQYPGHGWERLNGNNNNLII